MHTLTPNLRRFIRRRLINIGVKPNHALEISELFQRQVDNRGLAGAVDYLKRVGDQLIIHLKKENTRLPWVRTVRRTFPAFFSALNGYAYDILLRVSKLARAIRYSDVRIEQVRKVRDSAQNPYTGSSLGIKRCARLAKRGFDALGLSAAPYDADYSSPNLRFARVFKTYKSVSGDTPITERQLSRALIMYLKDADLRELPMEQCFHPFTKEFIARLKTLIPAGENPYVGCIGASQEGAGKLRMFAAPYTVFQHALYPIHYWVADNYNKVVPNICTYDQQAGAKWAQAQLRLGHVVHSVDLSAATCRWPLEPQLKLMAYAGLPERELNLLKRVSRGTWRLLPELRKSFGQETLQWSVGQPLGIAPSMSMFTLTHACVLAGLADELGVEPSFKILGDDVVIVGDELHRQYTLLLDEMKVPISYNKSHSSTILAEFAGYQITVDTMIRPGQWRPVHKANALALAEELGRPLEGEVTLLAKELQEFHLFRLGQYDPPSWQLPRFIRMLVLLVSGYVQYPTLAKAPLYDHSVQDAAEETLSQIKREFNLPYHPRQVGVRVFSPYLSEQHLIDNCFRPLRPWKDDSVVVHYMAASRIWSLGNHPMIAVNTFTCAFSLWERQLISDEVLVSLVASLKQAYYSMLDLTPRSSGFQELRVLYDNYLTLHRQVLKDPHFTSIEVREVVSKFTPLEDTYWGELSASA